MYNSTPFGYSWSALAKADEWRSESGVLDGCL